MTRFYFTYALRSILRGGQRSTLALCCIAFAVLSLVSMQLLAGMVRAATVVPPRAELGGDLAISHAPVLSDADIDRLEQLRANGTIEAYTLIAPNPRLTMARRAGSGRVHFLSRAFGVAARTYPLIGEVVLAEPRGATLASVLASPGDVIVTGDVAQRMAVSVGDTILLGGPGGAAPVPLRIAGIVSLLPDRKGDSLIYDLATARLLAGVHDVVASASIRASESIAPRLSAAGWTVRRASAQKRGSVASVFDFMLKGAGLLGLLLGGIGVANTMTVSLARRDAELAILKTVGYRRRDLLALLGCETTLLALAGSLGGGALALPVSALLMQLLDSTEGSLMLQYTVRGSVVATGVVAGLITSLVFGTYATMRAAAVRPALLLRQAALPPSARSRWTLALGALSAAAVFCVLSSAVMGSIAQGVGVVSAGVLGIVVLGGMFATLLVLLLRLPVPGALLNLARRNLQHRRGRAIVAVVALFVGSFTVGFASSAMLTARARYTAKRGSDAGSNVRIFSPVREEAAMRHALEQTRAPFSIATTAEVSATTAAGKALPVSSIEGRSAPGDVRIASGAWTARRADALYLPARFAAAPFNVRVGDTIVVRSAATTARLVVAGHYERTQDDWSFAAQPLITPTMENARRLGAASATLVATAALPVDRLDSAIEQLSNDLPRAMVVSKRDFNDLLVRAYTSLFLFVAGMAGLAFLAGVVLIANAVGLSLVERKRELGILKAIGYARRHVLATILIENAILGALAGATGVAAVHVITAITNQRFLQARMRVGAGTSITLFLLSITLALLTAAIVAWRPTRMRPLAVLRQD